MPRDQASFVRVIGAQRGLKWQPRGLRRSRWPAPALIVLLIRGFREVCSSGRGVGSQANLDGPETRRKCRRTRRRGSRGCQEARIDQKGPADLRSQTEPSGRASPVMPGGTDRWDRRLGSEGSENRARELGEGTGGCLLPFLVPPLQENRRVEPSPQDKAARGGGAGAMGQDGQQPTGCQEWWQGTGNCRRGVGHDEDRDLTCVRH